MRLSDKSHDPDAQARAWFARQQSQTLSTVEQHRLDEWLAASPAHRDAWQRVVEDWGAMDRYRDALASELNKARHNRPGRRTAPIYFKWAAAAVLLVVFIPALFYGVAGTTSNWRTAIGEQQQIKLRGGSILNLDTATRITITQTWFTNHIQLHEGEIYLEAAPGWPVLKVTAEDYEIRDIGTRFSVRHTTGRIMVKVAEGAVEVKNPTKFVLLQAGEKLSVNTGSNEWALAALAGGIAHWRKGLLVFDEHRLQDVLYELARYHDIQLNLPDPTVGEKRVSGRFRLDELDTNLQIIAETLKLNIENPAPGRYKLRASR